MSEFLTKKTGEVLAFGLAFKATLEKGESGFRQIFGENNFNDTVSANDEMVSMIEAIGEDEETLEAIEAKAEKTEEKIQKMRDLYLADEADWKDPAELSEWMGFFLGAAYVHWSLVEGKAREEGVSRLQEIAVSAMNLYEESLEEIAAFVKTL